MRESVDPLSITSRFGGWFRTSSTGGNWRSIIIAYFFALVLIGIGWRLAPGFVSPSSLLQQLVLASILGIITIGQMTVILTGNIDLSVSWMMNLCVVVLVSITGGGNVNVFQAILLSLLVAVGIGLFNGLGVAYLRLPSLVMTLGVNAMLKGATLVVTGAQPKGSAPDIIAWFVSGRVLGIPVAVLLWLALAIIIIFVMRRTIVGRTLYTTGNSQVVSFLSGIRIERTLITAFIISSVCNAIAGMLFLSYSGQVYLSLGEPYQMPAIAAVVIGGVSILGGSGNYVGVIAGVLILILLQNVLQLASVAYAGQLIIYGLAILAMLFVYGRGRSDR